MRRAPRGGWLTAKGSTAARQLDLALALWLCLGGAALAAHLFRLLRESEPGLPIPDLPPGVWVLLFLAGLGVLLVLRWRIARRSFRLLTDGETFLLLARPAQEPVFLLRRDVRSIREDLEGLTVDTASGEIRIEGEAEPLILVHYHLTRWLSQEGRPQDPPHTPPYAR